MAAGMQEGIVERGDFDLKSIEMDHNTLRVYTARLDGMLRCIAHGDSSEEAEIRRTIDQFCLVLFRHLETEESSGVLEQAAEAEPRLAMRVDALHVEHTKLRKGVTDLFGGAVDGDWGEFHTRFTAFCDLLATHERAENEVLMDAYLEDIGGHN